MLWPGQPAHPHNREPTPDLQNTPDPAVGEDASLKDQVKALGLTWDPVPQSQLLCTSVIQETEVGRWNSQSVVTRGV